MFYFRLFLLLAAICVASILHASEAFAKNCFKDGFLPPNEMKIPVDSFLANGFSRESFDRILDKIEKLYAPVIRQHRATLVVDRQWEDGTVNAYAERSGENWIIRIYGGLARHRAMTADGFALVSCHEIGHHVGGLPKYQGQWPANEGQSDYFAVLKCLRAVFEHDDNEEIIKQLEPHPAVTQACSKTFSDTNDRAICVRVAMGGLAAAKVIQELSGAEVPNFDTPDPSVVAQTYDEHPGAQCRLDTYFEGSHCEVPFNQDVSETDPTVGVCSIEKNFQDGNRPRCWYKSQTGGDPTTPTPGIARPLLLNGSTSLVVNNPYLTIYLNYDVSDFQASGGAYVEVSQPNQNFIEPNGVSPDPYRLLWGIMQGRTGTFAITPINQLPGWGTYSLRVIPLDGSGQRAVGRFSNASTLFLYP